MKRVLALSLALATLPGCASLGPLWKGIDKVCVGGQIGSLHAEFITAHPEDWRKRNPDARPVAAGDRIVHQECSLAARLAEDREKKDEPK
jgi:hypothetical protein